MVPSSQDLNLIRWGSFVDRENKPKIAAFKVSMLEAHFAHEAGKNLVDESDRAVKQKQEEDGSTHQAYEWNGQEFEMVDINMQEWFKF